MYVHNLSLQTSELFERKFEEFLVRSYIQKNNLDPDSYEAKNAKNRV